MNTIQTNVMKYLTSGEGTTDYRMRALRELAELDFFGTSIEESASRVVLRDYAIAAKSAYACNEGVDRLLAAVGVEVVKPKRTLRVILDVSYNDGDGMVEIFHVTNAIKSGLGNGDDTGRVKATNVAWLDYRNIIGQPYDTENAGCQYAGEILDAVKDAWLDE